MLTNQYNGMSWGFWLLLTWRIIPCKNKPNPRENHVLAMYRGPIAPYMINHFIYATSFLWLIQCLGRTAGWLFFLKRPMYVRTHSHSEWTCGKFGETVLLLVCPFRKFWCATTALFSTMWWFQRIVVVFYSTGEMIQFDLCICFNWVVTKTTNHD